MARTKPHNANDPATIDKERRTIELRRAGATFDDIARAIGYADAATAYNAYKRALKRSLIDAGSEEARTVELDRLDRLQRSHWNNAISGDVAATNVVLRIMDRRARLLGLDAPIKHDITVETIDPTSIDAEVARLVKLLGTNDAAASQ